LGKKSLKKNKYSVNTNIDVYREEFSKNTKTTYLSNIFNNKGFNLSANINTYGLKKNINNNTFLYNGMGLNNLFLKTKKKTLSSENFISSDIKYLFLDFSYERFLKSNFFKKTQRFNNSKDITSIDSFIFKIVKT
jgi:hypothetical protein